MYVKLSHQCRDFTIKPVPIVTNYLQKCASPLREFASKRLSRETKKNCELSQLHVAHFHDPRTSQKIVFNFKVKFLDLQVILTVILSFKVLKSKLSYKKFMSKNCLIYLNLHEFSSKRLLHVTKKNCGLSQIHVVLPRDPRNCKR